MVKPSHAKYLPHAGKSPTVVIIKNFETEKVTKKGHAHHWRLCWGICGVSVFVTDISKACATEVPINVDKLKIMHMG